MRYNLGRDSWQNEPSKRVSAACARLFEAREHGSVRAAPGHLDRHGPRVGAAGERARPRHGPAEAKVVGTIPINVGMDNTAGGLWDAMLQPAPLRKFGDR